MNLFKKSLPTVPVKKEEKIKQKISLKELIGFIRHNDKKESESEEDSINPIYFYEKDNKK